MNFEKILNDLFNMPYFKNYDAASGAAHNISNHESAIEDVFIINGMSRASANIGKKKVKIIDEGAELTKALDSLGRSSVEARDAWISGDLTGCKLKNGEYIKQPCSKNNNPDFLLRINNRVYAIEAKSVDDSYSPVYNSGSPKNNCIYVFASKNTNSTAVYLGKEYWMTEDGRELNSDKTFISLYEAMHSAAKALSELMKSKNLQTGANFYLRDMWIHSGEQEHTNYFKEPRRTEWFNRVLEFVK